MSCYLLYEENRTGVLPVRFSGVRSISGVLAGLANYFDQDPVLFRIIAIVFLVATGVFPGLLFYLAAWVLMPKNQKSQPKVDYEVVE